MFKSNPTWYGVYPVYFESITKRSYASLSRKKLGFHTETCEFRDQRIFKTGLFHRMKELFKPNQTQYVWSNPCLPRVWNKNCYCWPGKKWVLLTEICCYFEYLVFKCSIFHRVKKLSKSNKTWYGLCHVYLERRTKKNCHRLPRKKVSNSYGKFRIFRKNSDYSILKIDFYHRVKECSNQTNSVWSIPRVLGIYNERIYALACPGKSWVFIRKYANFAINKF